MDGWRVWQHNDNPDVKFLVADHVDPDGLREVIRVMGNDDPQSQIPIRVPWHRGLDIEDCAYNQTITAGVFPAQAMLDHYHLVVTTRG